jgi:hypothetical protein
LTGDLLGERGERAGVNELADDAGRDGRQGAGDRGGRGRVSVGEGGES